MEEDYSGGAVGLSFFHEIQYQNSSFFHFSYITLFFVFFDSLKSKKSSLHRPD